MSGYRAPKKRLHRDFVYLDHDTVLNSLSAFEAGSVDEILHKTSEAAEGGGEAGLKIGPAKAGLKGRRESEIKEELVRRRTWFSAFDAWLGRLEREDAIGSFEHWDLAVRNQLRVGDTVNFRARVRLSPLHVAFATFASYAKAASPRSPTMRVSAKDASEAQSALRIMEALTGAPGSQSASAYLEPVEAGADAPRLIGRLRDKHLVRSLGELDGVFSVIGQIDALLAESDQFSAVRLFRDAPATPLETQTMATAMANFKGSATEALGLSVTDADITYTYPAVLVQLIAIYR